MMLPDIRKRFAEVSVAAREGRDDLTYARARAEARAIEAAGGEKQLGGNAEARERALLIALEADEAFQGRLETVRALEQAVADVEAELESAKDLRREREWVIRLRLAAALDGQGIQSDAERSEIVDEPAFDDATDARAADLVTLAADTAATEMDAAETQGAYTQRMTEQFTREQFEPWTAATETVDPSSLPF